MTVEELFEYFKEAEKFGEKNDELMSEEELEDLFEKFNSQVFKNPE